MVSLTMILEGGGLYESTRLVVSFLKTLPTDGILHCFDTTFSLTFIKPRLCSCRYLAAFGTDLRNI